MNTAVAVGFLDLDDLGVCFVPHPFSVALLALWLHLLASLAESRLESWGA